MPASDTDGGSSDLDFVLLKKSSASVPEPALSCGHEMTVS